MTTQEAVNMAAAGQESPVVLYWDDQDPANKGPAYRYADASGSGSLEFSGWSGGAPGDYRVEHFFDNDCKYGCPDAGGVHPMFAV